MTQADCLETVGQIARPMPEALKIRRWTQGGYVYPAKPDQSLTGAGGLYLSRLSGGKSEFKGQ